MAASTKVVKIEDVELLPGRARTFTFQSDSDSNNTLEEEESKDTLYELPTNWPKIPELDRRRSCEETLVIEPCINKAVAHLGLLQNCIDEWFRKEKEDRSLSSSNHGSILAVLAPRKQLRFADDGSITVMSTPSRQPHSVSSTSRSSSHMDFADDFSIKGVGARADKDLVSQVGLDIPYLGADDVIEEVLLLLARLEKDRQETGEKLVVERNKMEVLTDKIDSLCLKRLRDLPVLVQREHEACILDLNELTWHVAYSGRQEARMNNRKEIADTLNTRLKEDIIFVERHIPLVKEKLLLEMEAMDKIKKAQSETDQELEMTKQRQAKTEQKSEEATNKAHNERGHIKRELDTVRDSLSHISGNLSEAKMTYNSYVHLVNEIKQQLKENEEETLVLQVKDENAKIAEQMQQIKVEDLKFRITDGEVCFVQLKGKNEQLEQKLKLLIAQNTSGRSRLLKEYKDLESKLRTMLLQSQELEMEIRDLEEKMAAVNRQKKKNEKNLARIQRELKRTEALLKKTLEEFASVLAVNQHLAEELRIQEENALLLEEEAKAQLESLRKQVKDEMHTRTVLQARINADSTEMQKVRVNSGHKHNKAEKVSDDVETAVKKVLAKVTKLRQLKLDKEARKHELVELLELLRNKHQGTRDDLTDKIAIDQPKHALLKKELLDLDKRIEHMAWRSEIINDKLDDMTSSEGMMKRLIKKTQATIYILTSEFNEEELQMEAILKVENDLRLSHEQCLERLRIQENKHQELMKARQQVYIALEAEKKINLDKNKSLASRYRKLQNEFFALKEKLLGKYDRRVKLESTITDTKQLQSLQQRLHSALCCFFKLNSLYNKAELEKLEGQANRNAIFVGKIQTDMDAQLAKISNFLSVHMNGDMAKSMAENTLAMQEDARAQGLETPEGVYQSRPSTVMMN